MDHGLQPKSRLAAVTFKRELLCLNRACAVLNITSHWQDPDMLIFVMKVYQKRLGRILKPLVSKFSGLVETSYLFEGIVQRA